MSETTEAQIDAEAEMDALVNMLCLRCDDLQSERQAALDENDALRAENVALRKEVADQARQLSKMRGA